MKQVIEWKKIDKNFDEPNLYYLKTKYTFWFDMARILTGRMAFAGGQRVITVYLDHTEVTFPLSKFTHYAEVE